LPKLDTTPPVTKTYFADIAATSLFNCWVWTYLVGTIKYGRNSIFIEAKMVIYVPCLAASSVNTTPTATSLLDCFQTRHSQ
jgi:hypothetical protein